MSDPVVRAARVLCALFLGAMTALVGYVIVARFGYPGELEWMTGAVMDHIERVRAHQPIYAAPSADWIPFIYTPGYYWVVAAISPTVACARGVSLASSLISAGCTYFMARKAGASRYFAALAPLMFIGCFGYVCAWFDTERSDPLMVALLTIAACVLQQSTRWLGAACAGVLVALAFFVKQPASTFVVLVPLVLLLAGRTKRALAFVAGAGAIGLPLFAWLQSSTHGWFSFYCLELPSAHGMAAKYITLFFISDLSKAPVLTVATIASVAALVSLVRTRLRRAPVEIEEPWLVLVAFVVAGFVASATSRMHVGGWPNVLVFWTAFAVPAAFALASKVEASAPRALMVAMLAAFALQVGSFAPDPNEAVPDSDSLRASNAVVSRVHELEGSSGDVLLFGRGHVTSKRHPHLNALVDVMRAGKPLPKDLADAIEGRKFQAIVLNAMEDIRMPLLLGKESDLFAVVTRNYFVAERFDDAAPMPVVGFPTTPRWVLRPRRAPLELDHDGLLRRQFVEMGLADANMRITQGDPARRSDGLDIEARAADIDR